MKYKKINMRHNFYGFRAHRKILMLAFNCMLLLLGCGVKPSKENRNDTKTVDNLRMPIQEHTVQSVLWQQVSSEYRALCHQAYNLAQLQLESVLNSMDSIPKPLAIITDIDETVLDNSPFLGKLIELDEEFSKEKWTEWGRLIEAEPVPGALDFFSYAHSKRVDVFYISNRYDGQLEETIKNLEKLGFPNADKKHVLLRTESSEKEPRRKIVGETHNVVMLLGDNLSDFLKIFEVNSTSQRNFYGDSLKTQFGKKFIVLPNPMYGDWEGRGVYEGDYDRDPSEKNKIRRSKIMSY